MADEMSELRIRIARFVYDRDMRSLYASYDIPYPPAGLENEGDVAMGDYLAIADRIIDLMRDVLGGYLVEPGT